MLWLLGRDAEMSGARQRRVVVTSPLPVDVRSWLPDDVDVRVPPEPLSRPALLGAVSDADALICLLTDRIDEEILERGRHLAIVANFAVGFDNVDVAAATRRAVAVTNTPDVLTEATADLTWALMLAVARRLVEADALARSGTWTGWEPGQLLGAAVHGQTLGVIGHGRIGQAVAKRASGFEMRVLHTSLHGGVRLEELLAESDFVSIHTPLTQATRHLIGRAELARMKKTAILVNTARGACVDEEALADALEGGTIAGAGLDVHEREPAIHPRLAADRRCVVLPHIGSATRAARSAMARTCAVNVAARLEGRRPPNVVNPEALA